MKTNMTSKGAVGSSFGALGSAFCLYVCRHADQSMVASAIYAGGSGRFSAEMTLYGTQAISHLMLGLLWALLASEGILAAPELA